MNKLILHCGLALGDLVMLTAAIRDLHLCYPNQFLTDVRTSQPELWQHNPYITRIRNKDPKARHLDCKTSLVNDVDKKPYHFLHGFIDFLNSKLKLCIRPTAYRADIHLSRQDKAWFSQVREVTAIDVPFWIVAAGGKYDIPIKWWETSRYQEVIDTLRGRVQFVQVGGYGHHHPKLRGVIDFRGQTNLRELIRLVYHSQGILCAPTALMHLAAAVDTKKGNPPLRACVVVSGGREPVHWEQYPGHQYLHTIGALPCCAEGGCWKDRAFRLRDGEPSDNPKKLCTNVVGNLPKCLDMIDAAEVVQRIKTYFEGGVLKYLSARQAKAAETGIAATAKNWYDNQPLTLSGAGMACDEAATRCSAAAPSGKGRGIVICGGGVKYFTNAWVCINMLRDLGCKLPVEVWHLSKSEMSEDMVRLLKPLNARTVNAAIIRKKNPVRILKGWELKCYSIIHSGFQEVLLLDADNVPVVNPEFLFETTEFKETGVMFWPDFVQTRKNNALKIWRSCGLSRPDEREFETGQMLVDKQRCAKALNLSMWFNGNSDFYNQHIYGDKETFHLAFRKAEKSYHLVKHPIVSLEGTMCQHDPQGRRLFQHRNRAKWDLISNRRVEGFWLEEECLNHVRRLRELWDGGVAAHGSLEFSSPRSRRSEPQISVVIAGANKIEVQRTKENLASTDWNGAPLYSMVVGSQSNLAGLFDEALSNPVDFLLILQGELVFNQHLRHNLARWNPMRLRQPPLSALHNPDVPEIVCDFKNNARLSRHFRRNSQAFLLPAGAAKALRRRNGFLARPSDLSLSAIARRLKCAVIFHAPSLAQRPAKAKSATDFHSAVDFDQNWRA